jgi:hypothetical protein
VKVLVVDDEVRLAQSLARGLRAEGFTVDLAHDGLSGRDAAMSGAYDAVVSGRSGGPATSSRPTAAEPGATPAAAHPGGRSRPAR